MDLGKALVDREVLTGKVVHVADVATDPRVYDPQAVRDGGRREHAVRAALGQARRDRRAARVRRRGHRFTADDGRFLGAIAAHGAVAIENADAYDGLRRSTTRSRASSGWSPTSCARRCR